MAEEEAGTRQWRGKKPCTKARDPCTRKGYPRWPGSRLPSMLKEGFLQHWFRVPIPVRAWGTKMTPYCPCILEPPPNSPQQEKIHTSRVPQKGMSNTQLRRRANSKNLLSLPPNSEPLKSQQKIFPCFPLKITLEAPPPSFTMHCSVLSALLTDQNASSCLHTCQASRENQTPQFSSQ